MASALTPAYQSWMNEAFGDVFADEPRSTCRDCAMCHAWAPAPAMVVRYEPSLKCCTYFPNLPNFLVGRILRDPQTAEGAARLRAAIARRAATPLGVHPTQRHTRRYTAPDMGFGKDHALRCPYLHDGGCSLWRHRNGVCQTFFCKVDGGAPGAAAWRSVTRLLMAIEARLAEHHAATLLGHPACFQRLLHPDGRRVKVDEGELAGVGPDGVIEPALYAELWGPHAGREEAYYIACAEAADQMTWVDVERVGGALVAGLTEDLRVRLAAHAAGVPARLRVAAIGVDVLFEDTVTGDVAAAVPSTLTDPAIVPRATWEALEQEGEAAIDALPDDARVELWRAGVLIEDEHAEDDGRPLSPDDRLRAGDQRVYREKIDFDAEGRAVVTLSAGAAELTFDEPDMLQFGRSLYARRHGFLVREALGWGEPPAEKVLETLQTLIDMRILERR